MRKNVQRNRENADMMLGKSSISTVRSAEFKDIAILSGIITREIIPYCLRLIDNSFIANGNLNITDPEFTFAELYKENITSEQLLSWSATIDQVELYQMFLNNVTNSSSLFESENLFYNCTSPWFGPFCRFALDAPDENPSGFSNMFYTNVLRSFELGYLTCYKHLHCETWLPCLDWREICDRKVDCFDGSDELNCWQLEINECGANEYRCHNGQCIPREFFHDNSIYYLDCMDQTDEPTDHPAYLSCPYSTTFQCEEHVCRPDRGFSCRDGTCDDDNYIEHTFCRIKMDKFLIDDICSITTNCFMRFYNFPPQSQCEEACPKGICPRTNCPSLYQFPSFPVLYGHVHFVFMNKERDRTSNEMALPDYVCYDEKRCSDFLPPTTYLNNSSCRRFSELGLNNRTRYENINMLVQDLKKLFRMCLITLDEIHHCNSSTMYQCFNSSKCISKSRLLDRIQDCPFNDDETFNNSCSLNDHQYRVRCSINGTTQCLSPLTYLNGKYDCDNGEDELLEKRLVIEEQISFQIICDGIEHFSPLLIDGKNETDETECQYWSCNNTYTRCDGYWTCQNGTDELNCPPCPEFHHKCIFPNDTSKMSCIPMTRINDGIVDCLGGADERNYCRTHYSSPNDTNIRFRCWNDTKCIDVNDVCAAGKQCKYGDDESLCPERLTCKNQGRWTHFKQFICTLTDQSKQRTFYLKLNNMPNYSSISANNTQLISRRKREISSLSSSIISNRTIVEPVSDRNVRCHRGAPILIRLTNQTLKLACLCPPSYYGESCEYQNERVSMILKIRSLSDWRKIFTFLILLIDDQNEIESYDYIHYQSIRDCQAKFNIHLLYSTRPKNLSKNYSIRIDKYNLNRSKYQGSWIYPIQFSFLPVYFLSILLTIPITDIQPLKTCQLSCHHGQCYHYLNNEYLIYCHCELGWFGSNCNMKSRSNCAPGSISINEFICLCPFDRYGHQCYLANSLCKFEQCLNGGQCVPNDQRHQSNGFRQFRCICSEEYTGDQCQYRQNQIDLSFDNQIEISSLLILDFITVHNQSKHVQRTIRKKLSFNQYSLRFYISFSFHIAFAQINQNYYLIILREEQILSSNIQSQVRSSHRCLSLSEIFNQTIINQHLLKRIKYYQIPCREYEHLICFYDSTQFCLCNLNRETNCFQFNFTDNSRCRSNDYCENNGFCFEDDPKCPQTSSCACLDCYFGSRCQLSTKESTLSLDTILVYHIQPQNGINNQPILINISIGVISLMFLLGLINGILSIITFQTKNARQVGVGYYLLTSSIISIIIMSILTMKFWFLLLLETALITNVLFLKIQCMLIDYILRFLLSTSDWLSACVAIERVLNVSQGIKFDGNQSKRIAKWIIGIILFVTISTHIHDPIHRHLLFDEEEQRIWCMKKYSPPLKIYDSILNVIHFAIPFSINCISSVLLILRSARTRSNAQKKFSYRTHLHQQFHLHKHLLISSFLLILFGISRLIFSFFSSCMKSPRDSWFYLIGYFLSYLPPISTFIVFVLPSDTYKKELLSAIHRF